MARTNLLPNGSNERFLRALEDHAKASTTLAELGRQNVQRLEDIRDALHAQTRLLDNMARWFNHIDESRVAAVQGVKDHITMAVAERDGWWRRAFVILGIALVLANLAGVALGRLLEAVKP